ncbi:MAG: hypothetical protein DRG69_08215, partial [Deltaproteobacteria bacterium]
MWEFPGGKVEEGETYQEALVREIKEELGVEVTVRDLIGIFRDNYKERRVKIFLFLCDIKDGNLEAHECESFAFFPINDLEQLNMIPVDKRIVSFLWRKSKFSFKEAKEYINSFINYEKRPYFSCRELRQERVSYLFKILGIDVLFTNFIHIAGTKGKGSVATFFAYLLASAGFKVGLYISPHIYDFRERIKILEETSSCKVREKKIPPHVFSRILGSFKSILDNISIPSFYGRISFFEILTALAFRYFKEEDVDFAVVEAGLGGRLDATNILSSPKLCVITSVDYDHTHILGKSLAKIAYEKAGIIKKNSSVISAVQSEEVESVLREKCAATHSSLFILGKDFFIKNLRQTKHSSFFDLHTPGKKIRKLEVRLLGLHQVFNASLAVFGSVILSGQGYSLSEREIRKGIKEARLEGRFEIVSKDPFIVVDVAHNVSSLKIVKEAVTFYF